MTLQCLMIAGLLPLSIAASGGCHEPAGARTIRNPDPAVKIPAIKEAVAERDRDEIPGLIKNLQSDDPAVRLFAIEGLRRLTGEDLGYDYYADPDRRGEAVRRWQRWLETHGKE